jgi:hypothetical protein
MFLGPCFTFWLSPKAESLAGGTKSVWNVLFKDVGSDPGGLTGELKLGRDERDGEGATVLRRLLCEVARAEAGMGPDWGLAILGLRDEALEEWARRQRDACRSVVNVVH